MQSPFGNPRPSAAAFVPTQPAESAFAECLAEPDSIVFKAIGFTEAGRAIEVYVALGREAGPNLRRDLMTMASQLTVAR